jgi:hypothetical protein
MLRERLAALKEKFEGLEPLTPASDRLDQVLYELGEWIHTYDEDIFPFDDPAPHILNGDFPDHFLNTVVTCLSGVSMIMDKENRNAK